MRIIAFLKKTAVITFVVGGLAGIAFALTAEQIDHYTSSNEFCTSCHAMKTYIAGTDTYKTSTHQTTSSGVRPKCADCHIPKGLVSATYAHVVNGAGDLWGEFSLNYQDPKVWDAEKARLAYSVRDWMRANDSVTCRSCHVQAAIKPKRKRGQRQHEEARKSNMTCIDCHYNLVHEEIEPRESFLDLAGKKQ